MLLRTDSFTTYTLGETFHTLPSRHDKKFMTKHHVLILDYDRKKGVSGVHVRRGLDSRSNGSEQICADATPPCKLFRDSSKRQSQRRSYHPRQRGENRGPQLCHIEARFPVSAHARGHNSNLGLQAKADSSRVWARRARGARCAEQACCGARTALRLHTLHLQRACSWRGGVR